MPAAQFVMEEARNALVSMQQGRFVPCAVRQDMNPETGRMRIRMVDVASDRYKIACSYMLRLKKGDFEDKRELAKLATAAKMAPEKLKEEFGYLVGDEATNRCGRPRRHFRLRLRTARRAAAASSGVDMSWRHSRRTLVDRTECAADRPAPKHAAHCAVDCSGVSRSRRFRSGRRDIATPDRRRYPRHVGLSRGLCDNWRWIVPTVRGFSARAETRCQTRHFATRAGRLSRARSTRA